MKFSGPIVFILGVLLLGGPSVQSAGGQGTADLKKVLIPHPSWNCGMADGIPAPESGTIVFEAQMQIENIYAIGKTPYGNRQVAVMKDGMLSGAKLSGIVTPGALDFELKLSNGVIEIEQILVLKTSSGQYIYVRTAGTGENTNDVRVVMDFEAPNASEFAWLNSGKYVARRVVNVAAKTMTLRVYDVSGVAVTANSSNVIRIAKPSGVPEQPWDYRKAAPGEKQGSILITESVTLSPSLRVGATKRGVNRNIIPITGGDLSGRITGKVLAGGADYQNLSAPATIDAKYLWQTTDGEVIIVRNAGPFGSLVPTFEVRTNSPYAWLNTGTYLSSNPGPAAGGVGITMYDSTH
jgi:hypothetical protein